MRNVRGCELQGRASSAVAQGVSGQLGIVEEEIDESIYWLELLIDAELLPSAQLDSLREEAEELASIVVAAIRKTKANLSKGT